MCAFLYATLSYRNIAELLVLATWSRNSKCTLTFQTYKVFLATCLNISLKIHVQHIIKKLQCLTVKMWKMCNSRSTQWFYKQNPITNKLWRYSVTVSLEMRDTGSNSGNSSNLGSSSSFQTACRTDTSLLNHKWNLTHIITHYVNALLLHLYCWHHCTTFIVILCGFLL